MRTRKYIFANWKATKTLRQSRETLSEYLQHELSIPDNVIIGFALSPVALSLALDYPSCIIMAQDLSEYPAGAHTGETTLEQLSELGVEYAIVGHSERRHEQGEDSNTIIKKVALALSGGITPILCFGETLIERQNNTYTETLHRQLAQLLTWSPDEIQRIIFAYEPVWAIGTGLTASIENIREISEYVRNLFPGVDIALIYGGSVNGTNASEILSDRLIDGVLVGSASNTIAAFLPIIQALSD